MVRIDDEDVFLATTANSEFWDKNANKVLFLGEWCKLYGKKEEYQNINSETLEYHWTKKENIDNGIKICDQTYKIILHELVEILNKYHNIDKSDRYWDILLRPWLLVYIQIIYDRYTHLLAATEKYNNLYTFTLNDSFYQFIDIPESSMNLIMNNDDYNLQIYSQIIKFLNIKSIDKNKHKEPSKNLVIKFKSNSKEILLRNITRLVNGFFHTKNVLISAPYFKNKAFLKIIFLWMKSKFLFTFDNFKYEINLKTDIDLELRKILFNSKKKEKNFFCLVFQTLIYNFPSIYIEGYKEFKDKVSTLGISIPNVLYTAQLIHGNEIFKFYVAENNNTFIKCYGQHGGGYGTDFLNIPEEIEKNFSDIFFSYGWIEKKVKPMVIPSITNVKNIRNNGAINFVLNNMPRYFYRFTYQAESTKGIESIENIKIFINELKNTNNLKIRLYPRDFELDVKARLLEVGKSLFFNNHKSYYKELFSSKLNIFSHFSTGSLESLSLNKPTIIIIPKEIYYFRDESKRYIEKLIDVNILFENPKTAAIFIDNIYTCIDAWWLSSEVQEARNAFCERYARSSDTWIDEWVDELRKVVNT